MDELDQLILRALQDDGRTPFTVMAREAGVSETTIRSRYRGLVEAGIVRTVGVVDPLALGYQSPAIVAISVEPGALDSVAGTLVELPEVSYLVMTLGSYDLIAEVNCRDRQHLADLITKRMHLTPGVRDTEALIIGRSYKPGYRWSLPAELGRT